MARDTNTASAFIWALEVASQYGGAKAALAALGPELPDLSRYQGLEPAFAELLESLDEDSSIQEALALGVLAGRPAHERRRAPRWQDPTSFVMDRDLVVEAAAGESILRLPWFEDELFVGRRLPDIAEMPKPVRKLCVENYSGALAGERRRFTFISYGHAYTVDAVPVRGEGGPPESVLAIATPSPSSTRAAEAYEGLAGRLDRTAAAADERAECSRHLGRSQAETAARRIAERAREDAARARANARRTRGGGPLSADSHAISPRETEVLDLASHGLNIAEIGEQLCISPATVKNHFEHIYVKLGVSNRVAAVAMGLRHGLIN